MSRMIAVVTGASRGIGRAICHRLARDHDIVAAARSRPDLERLRDEIGAADGHCRIVVVDVADPEQVAVAFEGITADVLVNNAGLGVMKPFLELAPEEWRAMVDVNFNALYHVTRALLPGMVARHRGHVITIGSLAGRNAFAGGSCYAATKHAVIGWSESLMLEVRDAGVRVSVVMPGSVATDFSPGGAAASWKLAPEDVAEAVAHIVAAPPNAHVSRIEIRPSRPAKRS